MTGFPADRRGAGGAVNAGRMLVLLAVAAIAAAGASTGEARAQGKVPMQLAPPESLTRGGGGSGNAPGDTAPAADAFTPSGEIVVQRLGGIDREVVGLLAPGQGGLDVDVWRGSSRALVADLLRSVPGTIASPSLRDLVRRLLLTSAPPPVSAGVDNVSILALRGRLLVAMGEPSDADALVAAASRHALGPELAWPAFDARLLTGDAAGACRLVRELGGQLTSIEGQKALIFCQLLAEQKDPAQFGLSLLRERRAESDTLYFTLAEGLAFGYPPRTGEAVAAGAVTPLNLALLRMAWAEVPGWFAEQASPGIVEAIARTPDLAEGVRLAAAIRAEAAGALPAADLRALFEQLKVTPQELASALTIADTEKPARAVALLYLAARAQTVPAARAEALQRMWEIAAQYGVRGTAARLAAPLLAEIPLLSGFSWFAGTASRMSLLAGDLPRALGWYDTAAAASGADPVALETATALWPLVRLALGDVRRLPPAPAQVPAADVAREDVVVTGAVRVSTREPVTIVETLPLDSKIALPWDRRKIDRWVETDFERHRDVAPARAGMMLALLDAVGDPVRDTLWRATLPGLQDGGASKPAAKPSTPPIAATEPAFRLGLDRAAAAGRQGEAILFAAAVLGGRDAGSVDPATLHAIVDGLARIGFPDLARAVARDAAVASGL